MVCDTMSLWETQINLDRMISNELTTLRISVLLLSFGMLLILILTIMNKKNIKQLESKNE